MNTRGYASLEEEPLEFEVTRLVSYLEYSQCRVLNTYPCAVVLVENERTGVSATVPAERSLIQRELIYWICLKLGVNMPIEFQHYQQLWDSAQPEGFDPAKRLL